MFVAKIQSAEKLYEKIVDSSSLARTLVDILESTTNKHLALIELNSSLYLSFQATHPLTGQGPLLSMRSANARQLFSVSGNDEIDFPMMRPYKSLLLLSDPEEIVRSLPADPSPLLVELVQLVTPSICFEDIKEMLDCSLSQIYRLAAHLAFWKQAKIIDSISSRNVYVVSRTAALSKIQVLSESFSMEFPLMPQLVVILAQLEKARPYSTCLSDFAENRNTLL